MYFIKKCGDTLKYYRPPSFSVPKTEHDNKKNNKNKKCGASPHTAAKPPFLFSLLPLRFEKRRKY